VDLTTKCNFSELSFGVEEHFVGYSDAMKKISPPESTKRIKNCNFRVRDEICCNARNYLRPHKCNEFCVEKPDRWLREKYPELDEKTIVATITELTSHESK